MPSFRRIGEHTEKFYPDKDELKTKKDFSKLFKSEETDALRILRNKVYAHNDAGGDETIKAPFVSYSDVCELIEFALECTRFVMASLTKTEKPDSYVNIGDWEQTIMLVRLGLKFRDSEENDF